MKHSLTLLSFSTPAHLHDVRGVLRELNYRVCPMPGEQWLYGGGVERLNVLILGVQSLPEGLISEALARCTGACLAIIGAQAVWYNTILDRCAEFSTWPCQAPELALRLQRLERRQASRLTREPVQDARQQTIMVGRSPAFLRALEHLGKIARCDAPALLEGETGTGKELAARAIHYGSARGAHPFIPVNCGALPDTLIENELFGHERGAFTDARSACKGLIAQAEGGTLFLDEVEALSAKGQVALLRFLQDRHYRSLGGQRLLTADVRVVAASNTSLAALCGAGMFRPDLYYRLNLLSVTLPPLRERGADVELLAEHFLAVHAAQHRLAPRQLHPAARQWLYTHTWPGNVRELDHLIQRDLLLSEEPMMGLGCVASETMGARRVTIDPVSETGFSQAKAAAMSQFEQAYLTQVLREAQGNVTHAAARAGKERRALGRLLKKHGIDRRQFAGYTT